MQNSAQKCQGNEEKKVSGCQMLDYLYEEFITDRMKQERMKQEWSSLAFSDGNLIANKFSIRRLHN